jgi:hypothetical protein
VVSVTVTVGASGPRLSSAMFLWTIRWNVTASGDLRFFESKEERTRFLEGGEIVVCGRTILCCTLGSGPRGKGGGVHLAVTQSVTVSVSMVNPVVIVRLMVRVGETVTALGRVQCVREMVLQGTVVVAGGRMVDPVLVEVWVIASQNQYMHGLTERIRLTNGIWCTCHSSSDWSRG